MQKGRPWIAFFSQSGSEIKNIAHELGRWPDVIITNKRPEHLREIVPEVAERTYFINNNPSLEEYKSCCMWHDNPIITLHGWLRIMPPEMCEQYEIYNGHPGLITKYPELKGKDPQIRAIEGDYNIAGCVLHKVTEGVDEGEVLLQAEFSLNGLDERESFRIFGNTSLILWMEFLRDKL